ncbi:MAG: hypothetical protein HKO94_08005, partial [Flavobacteriaceae bacterium]|nr:hypothetical protein [Flavobacteriaceae bacterium]
MKNFTIRILDSVVKSKQITLWSLVCFFILGTTTQVFSQAVPLETSAPANFGVDADAYSGILTFDTDAGDPDDPDFGTDDWLEGLSGLGVIDETSAANAGARDSLFQDFNINAEFRMSQDFGFLDVNNNRWLDAVFARDQRTNGNNTDMNVFGASADKNFDDPATWTIKDGSVPQKNDIIDGYAHIRRDGTFQSLWVFFGATTRSPNGDNYIDFEVFRSDVDFDANAEGLVNTGPNCGHTAYTFFPDGAPDQKGDLIFSTNYTNGGAAADVRVYAWIDSFFVAALAGDPNDLTDEDFIAYNALGGINSFIFGDGFGNYEFWPCNNTSGEQYGYARIIPESLIPGVPAIVAQDNTAADVDAPTWGTIDPGGDVTDMYIAPTFTEFGINATFLGIDGSQSTGTCENIFGSIIIKTRSSTSFTSELKDLSGPYDLGNTPEYIVTISGDNLPCTENSSTVLTATALPPGVYTYVWYKDDVEYDDGTGTPNDEFLTVTEPGSYRVEATISDGCTAESEPFVVELLEVPPTITCPPDVQLECTDSTDPADTGEATWIDGCGDVTLSFEDVFEPGCNPNVGVITRTWTVTDSLGNTDSCDQTITLVDTTSPTLSGEGASGTVECPDTLVFTPPTADDACDDAPEIGMTETSTTDECGLPAVTRTWIATDCSGNQSEPVSQTLTYVDTTPPTLSGQGPNGTVECPDTLVFTPPTADDACDDAPE